MSDVTIPQSPYAKFFSEFRGKNFIKGGQVIPKFVVWFESARGLALLPDGTHGSMETLKSLLKDRFSIQDKPGWKGGSIVDREVAHTYYYEGMGGVQEKHPQKYEKWFKN